MEFALSDEQEMTCASVERVFPDLPGFAAMRAAITF